jgi:hypothetical protein
MAQDPEAEVYLLYIWLRRINPLIWRRVLVRADNTLTDLHSIIQIAFSWTDFHLHRLRLHKKDFAVPRVEGLADAGGVPKQLIRSRIAPVANPLDQERPWLL